MSESDELTTTDIEVRRKLLFCSATLRTVQHDPGFRLLSERTQAMVDKARTPIGGWKAGLKRIKHFLEIDDDDISTQETR